MQTFITDLQIVPIQHPRHRLYAATLLALMLVACGNSGETTANAQQASASSAEQTPMPDACSLLSAEQAAAVLAMEASPMSEDPEACMYGGSAGVGNITMLMLILSDNDDVAMAQQVFSSIAGLQGNLASIVNQQVGEKTKKSGQEIDDLGDEAWLGAASVGASFGSHQIGSQQLVVRKGTRVLTLNVTGADKIDGLAARMLTLARSAAARL